MAIAPVGTPTATGSSTLTASYTATMPTGVAAGHLLLAFADNGTYASVTSVTSGWTLLTRIEEGATSTAAVTDVFWRVADGSDSLSVTYGATTRATVIVAAYSGVDTSSPFVASGGTDKAAADTAFPAPELTNTNAAAWGVYHVTSRGHSTAGIGYTAGAGLTERVDYDPGGTSTGRMVSMLADTAGGVATGAHTYTSTASSSSNNGTAWAAFLRPTATTTTVTKTAASTWVTTGRIVATRPAAWNTRERVTATENTRWDVHAPGATATVRLYLAHTVAVTAGATVRLHGATVNGVAQRAVRLHRAVLSAITTTSRAVRVHQAHTLAGAYAGPPLMVRVHSAETIAAPATRIPVAYVHDPTGGLVAGAIYVQLPDGTLRLIAGNGTDIAPPDPAVLAVTRDTGTGLLTLDDAGHRDTRRVLVVNDATAPFTRTGGYLAVTHN